MPPTSSDTLHGQRRHTAPSPVIYFCLLLVSLRPVAAFGGKNGDGRQRHPSPAGSAAVTQQQLGNVADTLFGGMDVNKDGHISKSEARDYFQANLADEGSFRSETELREAADEAVSLFYRNLDQQQHGPGGVHHLSITEQELEAHLQALFKKYTVYEWVQYGLGLPHVADAMKAKRFKAEDVPLLALGTDILDKDLGVASTLEQLSIVRATKRLLLGLGEPPAAPGGLACTPLPDGMALTWAAPSPPGKPLFHTLLLERRAERPGTASDALGWHMVAELPGASEAFVDSSSAALRGPQQYRLVAWNGYGRGPHARAQECWPHPNAIGQAGRGGGQLFATLSAAGVAAACVAGTLGLGWLLWRAAVTPPVNAFGGGGGGPRSRGYGYGDKDDDEDDGIMGGGGAEPGGGIEDERGGSRGSLNGPRHSGGSGGGRGRARTPYHLMPVVLHTARFGRQLDAIACLPSMSQLWVHLAARWPMSLLSERMRSMRLPLAYWYCIEGGNSGELPIKEPMRKVKMIHADEDGKYVWMVHQGALLSVWSAQNHSQLCEPMRVFMSEVTTIATDSQANAWLGSAAGSLRCVSLAEDPLAGGPYPCRLEAKDCRSFASEANEAGAVDMDGYYGATVEGCKYSDLPDARVTGLYLTPRGLAHRGAVHCLCSWGNRLWSCGGGGRHSTLRDWLKSGRLRYNATLAKTPAGDATCMVIFPVGRKPRPTLASAKSVAAWSAESTSSRIIMPPRAESTSSRIPMALPPPGAASQTPGIAAAGGAMGARGGAGAETASWGFLQSQESGTSAAGPFGGRGQAQGQGRGQGHPGHGHQHQGHGSSSGTSSSGTGQLQQQHEGWRRPSDGSTTAAPSTSGSGSGGGGFIVGGGFGGGSFGGGGGGSGGGNTGSISSGSTTSWQLLTGHANGCLLLWDIGADGVSPLVLLSPPCSRVNSLVLLPSLHAVAVGMSSGHLRLLQLPGLADLTDFRLAQQSVGEGIPSVSPACANIRAHNGGMRCAAGCHGVVTLSRMGNAYLWPIDRLRMVADACGFDVGDGAMGKAVSSKRFKLPAMVGANIINKEELTLTQRVREGSFGVVYKGTWCGTQVAVKRLREGLVNLGGSSVGVGGLGEGAAADFIGINGGGGHLGNGIGGGGQLPLGGGLGGNPNPNATAQGLRLEESALPAGRVSSVELEESVASLQQEVDILASLRHENVVLFLGVCLDPLCLVTSYYGMGSLYDVLRHMRKHPERVGTLTWRRRLNMALDAAKGMFYLHSREPAIVHCDLKSPNLLVDKDLNVKVGDFGLSQLCSSGSAGNSRGQLSALNPKWLPPEVLDGDCPFTPATDVYSYGIILWELMTLQEPFADMQLEQVLCAVAVRQERPPIPPAKDLPGGSFSHLNDYIHLMQDCWREAPTQRPGFGEIMARLQEMASELRSAASLRPRDSATTAAAAAAESDAMGAAFAPSSSPPRGALGGFRAALNPTRKALDPTSSSPPRGSGAGSGGGGDTGGREGGGGGGGGALSHEGGEGGGGGGSMGLGRAWSAAAAAVRGVASLRPQVLGGVGFNGGGTAIFGGGGGGSPPAPLPSAGPSPGLSAAASPSPAMAAALNPTRPSAAAVPASSASEGAAPRGGGARPGEGPAGAATAAQETPFTFATQLPSLCSLPTPVCLGTKASVASKSSGGGGGKGKHADGKGRDGSQRGGGGGGGGGKGRTGGGGGNLGSVTFAPQPPADPTGLPAGTGVSSSVGLTDSPFLSPANSGAEGIEEGAAAVANAAAAASMHRRVLQHKLQQQQQRDNDAR